MIRQRMLLTLHRHDNASLEIHNASDAKAFFNGLSNDRLTIQLSSKLY